MGRRQRLRVNTDGRPKCTASGKDIFSTETEAKNQLRAILSKPGALDNPYHPADYVDCGACGGFHLTSSPRKPGLSARRHKPARRHTARRTRHTQNHTHRPPDHSDLTHNADLAWTSGFHDTPGATGLTHRIGVDTLATRATQP